MTHVTTNEKSALKDSVQETPSKVASQTPKSQTKQKRTSSQGASPANKRGKLDPQDEHNQIFNETMREAKDQHELGSCILNPAVLQPPIRVPKIMK